jgi:glycosyltransferase involved in cell wall biosynthesis
MTAKERSAAGSRIPVSGAPLRVVPPRPSILGVVVTRNEWPLVGAAITHALNHHVDTVYVIDHGSSDGTVTGLMQLQSTWGEALKIYRFDDVPFLQEAMNATIVELTRDLCHEWLYIFDADEFILTPGNAGLRAILADIPPEFDAVRYPLDHYVPPRDFDGENLARLCEFKLFRCRERAPEQPLEIISREIESGRRLFYEIPFDSKVIARRRPGMWLAAGAHVIRGIDSPREYAGKDLGLRCAHLTYLSLKRLEQKADLGASHRLNRFPAHHGWQNQMLARLAAAGQLERYWSHHSYAAAGRGAGDIHPSLAVDSDYTLSVTRTVTSFNRVLQRPRSAAATVAERVIAEPVPARSILASLRSIIDRAEAIEERRHHLEEGTHRLCDSLAEATRTIAELQTELGNVALRERAHTETEALLLAERNRLAHELALARHDFTRPSVTARNFARHLPGALKRRMLNLVRRARPHLRIGAPRSYLRRREV